MLELGLALIAACLPSMSHLFTHFSVDSTVNSMRRICLSVSLRSYWHLSVKLQRLEDHHNGAKYFTETDHEGSAASSAEPLRLYSSPLKEHTTQGIKSTVTSLTITL